MVEGAGKKKRLQKKPQETLLPGEVKLIECLRNGKPCIFVHKGPKKVPSKDRTLRGDVLGKLLRSDKIQGVATITQSKKVKIKGALIKDKLDMSDTDTGMVIRMEYCRFTKPVQFTRAKLALLSFNHSDLNGAHMANLQIESHLSLDDIHNQGKISISSARIGGLVNINSIRRKARLTNKGDKAIVMQGAKIGGLFLNEVKVEGEVNCVGAEITGQFNATGASFHNSGNKAIAAEGIKTGGNIVLHKANIKGMVDIKRAEIAGSFIGTDASFYNPNSKAISGQGVRIKGGVVLRRVRVRGIIAFNNAEITEQFSAKGASLININGSALNLQDATLNSSLWLTSMPHPIIGNVNFIKANLSVILIDTHSFPLGRFNVDATRYDTLYSRGKAHLTCKGWLMPYVSDTNVTPHGYWPAFAALCDNFAKHGDNYLPAIELQQKARKIIETVIDEGYGVTRAPFAYRQFAKVLDANGHEREARDVRVLAGNAYTKRFLEDLNFPWRDLYRFWRFLIRHLTAYGTRPWQVFPWLITAWVFGGLVFWAFQDHMTPAREKYYMSVVDNQNDPLGKYTLGDTLPEGHPEFSPAIYALDIMLPIIDI